MATHGTSLRYTPPVLLNTRGAGIVILLSAIVSIIFILVDVGPTGTDPLSIMQSMVQVGPTHRLVHYVEMICLGGLMFGYIVLSQRLGLHRAPVIIGLMTYAFGVGLMFLATTLDGFVSVDTAAMFVKGAAENAQIGYSIIKVISGVMLNDVARISWILQAVAALSWAVALLGERGLPRVIGFIGLLAGAIPAVIVTIVGAHIDLTAVLTILLAQAVWNVAAAVLLLRCGGQQAAAP